jgi:hemolysin III
MYVLCGWMVIFAIKPIYDFLSVHGFVMLVAGGIAYTIGTFFYMSARIRYSHSIWHLFVLAGSVLHFFSVLTLI